MSDELRIDREILELENKAMNGGLVSDEKEKQQQHKCYTPGRATGSVDGIRLRPWNREANLATCGEPMNHDDQNQRRHH